MNSLNEFVDIIEGICTAHPQINKFVYGDFNKVNQDKDFKPVIVEVFPASASNTGQVMTLEMALAVYDKCQDDYSNLAEIHSKTLEIANDIIAQIKNGSRTFTSYNESKDVRQEFELQTTSFDPIYNEKNDLLQGWGVGVSVNIFNDMNACNL